MHYICGVNVISLIMQPLVRSNDIAADLASLLRSISYEGLFILSDKHTEQHCLPNINTFPETAWAKKFVIPAGDDNKNIDTLCAVWKFLSENEATRKSVLINLGGGMVTDLGGFAAATFKRGIRFINIPTTLLGAVDAAVGGKTGINFNGLKNEVGSFTPAEAVLIDANFFRTLDIRNLLSGYAEMLKHALLSTEKELNELLRFDWDNIDYNRLNDLLFDSIKIKQGIVEEDPHEHGIRKALNLGHTFGHAFESLSYEMKAPVLHGYAVAWGLVCELYLSWLQLGFNKELLMKVAYYIKKHYGKPHFGCAQYPRLIDLMQHDKKNDTGLINFTLLRTIGQAEINQTASREEIEEAMDFLRES